MITLLLVIIAAALVFGGPAVLTVFTNIWSLLLIVLLGFCLKLMLSDPIGWVGLFCLACYFSYIFYFKPKKEKEKEEKEEKEIKIKEQIKKENMKKKELEEFNDRVAHYKKQYLYSNVDNIPNRELCKEVNRLNDVGRIVGNDNLFEFKEDDIFCITGVKDSYLELDRGRKNLYASEMATCEIFIKELRRRNKNGIVIKSAIEIRQDKKLEELRKNIHDSLGYDIQTMSRNDLYHKTFELSKEDGDYLTKYNLLTEAMRIKVEQEANEKRVEKLEKKLGISINECSNVS